MIFQTRSYTLGQIRSMWDNGQITADAVARCSDSAEWFSLEQRITGAEENVEPQQQAVAAPSAKSLLTKPSFVRKYKRIPTIGKRGWLGLALVIFGMFWFINAKSAAEESGKQVWASGSYKYAELTGLAETAGYASYYDFLVNQNQTHSLGLIGFGTVLVVSGYWKYGRKRCRTVG